MQPNHRIFLIFTLLAGATVGAAACGAPGRSAVGGSPAPVGPAPAPGPASPPPNDPPAPAKTATGGACADHEECAGGFCVPWTNGYCSAQASSCAKLSCPAKSACTALSDGHAYCLASCGPSAPCRAGYVCTPEAVCLPSCETAGCPDGATCEADGLCWQGGGGGSGGGSGGGNGIDLTACTGPASSSGTLMSGATPSITLGKTSPTGAGAFSFELLAGPPGNVPIGAYAINLQFAYSPGQLDYPVGSVVGAVLQKVTSTGYQYVETTQMCELHLSTLTLASAPLVCDGMAVGTFLCLFSGNQPLGGSLQVPVRVAASQLAAPSCRAPNAPCSAHSDCCSSSCSMYIGVCN